MDYIDRNEFTGMMRKGGETTDEEKERFKVSRAFAKRVKEILGDAARHRLRARRPGDLPDLGVHRQAVRQGRDLRRHHRATTSTSTCATCGCARSRSSARTSRTPTSATKANELIESGQIRPVLWRTLGFEGVPEAHQLMLENKHLGKISILVGADEEGQGKTAEEPGAIRAEVGA